MTEAVVFDYGGVLATSQWDAFAALERRIGVDPGGLVPYFGLEHPDRPGTPAWQKDEGYRLAILTNNVREFGPY